MPLDNELKVEIANEAASVIRKTILGIKFIGELSSYLNRIGLSELIPEINDFQLNGDIYILGNLRIKENEIRGIFKSLEINLDRVKIIKGYDEFKNFNFKKFQYDQTVRLIFVGPLPHSTKDKGQYSSVIRMMEEEEEEYPKIVRLDAGGKLKITKSNLKKAIIAEIESGDLDTNKSF